MQLFYFNICSVCNCFVGFRKFNFGNAKLASESVVDREMTLRVVSATTFSYVYEEYVVCLSGPIGPLRQTVLGKLASCLASLHHDSDGTGFKSHGEHGQPSRRSLKSGCIIDDE
jgi:hypothetical protein